MIIKRFDSLLFFLVISFQQAFCQQNVTALQVISSPAAFKATQSDSSKELTDLSVVIPSVVFDLRYCSAQNFTGQKLYPRLKTTYMRRSAALALANLQKELMLNKLGLKIWDAYRPYSATQKMWNLVKDERYAANPKYGSGHNRGVAVDLTLIDLQTGKELDMGTGFDNFSDTAHNAFKNLPEKVLENRKLLRSLMEKYGFKALETEWWHYALPDAKNYELLNLSFRQVKKLAAGF